MMFNFGLMKKILIRMFEQVRGWAVQLLLYSFFGVLSFPPIYYCIPNNTRSRFGHSVRRPGQFVCPTNRNTIRPNNDKKYLKVVMFRFLLLFFAYWWEARLISPFRFVDCLFWLPAETLSLKRLRGPSSLLEKQKSQNQKESDHFWLGQGNNSWAQEATNGLQLWILIVFCLSSKFSGKIIGNRNRWCVCPSLLSFWCVKQRGWVLYYWYLCPPPTRSEHTSQHDHYRQTHIIVLVNKFGMSIGECANITGQSGGAHKQWRLSNGCAVNKNQQGIAYRIVGGWRQWRGNISTFITVWWITSS